MIKNAIFMFLYGIVKIVIFGELDDVHGDFMNPHSYFTARFGRIGFGSLWFKDLDSVRLSCSGFRAKLGPGLGWSPISAALAWALSR